MLDIKESRELQAVVLALRTANKDLVRDINFYSRKVIAPEFYKGLDSRARNMAELKLLAGTGRVKVSAQGVTLQAGGLSRRLSGGLSTDDARAVEFGAKRQVVETYRTKSRKGRAYNVTRHTQRQLKWSTKKGFVVYPTAVDLIPRIASLWVQTTVRLFAEAMEGKR